MILFAASFDVLKRNMGNKMRMGRRAVAILFRHEA